MRTILPSHAAPSSGVANPRATTAREKPLSSAKAELYPSWSVKSPFVMGVFVRISSAIGFLAVASLGVAACTQEKRTTPAPDTPAADYPVPVRQPGLWRQVSLVEGIDTPVAVKLCIDKATDAQMAWWGPAARRNCRTDKMSRKADGSWSFESDCQDANGVRIIRSGVVLGDFDRRYQIAVTTTVSGAKDPRLLGTRNLSIDAERLGGCPVGMRPGEVELPNGVRLRASDVLGPK